MGSGAAVIEIRSIYLPLVTYHLSSKKVAVTLRLSSLISPREIIVRDAYIEIFKLVNSLTHVQPPALLSRVFFGDFSLFLSKIKEHLENFELSRPSFSLMTLRVCQIKMDFPEEKQCVCVCVYVYRWWRYVCRNLVSYFGLPENCGLLSTYHNRWQAAQGRIQLDGTCSAFVGDKGRARPPSLTGGACAYQENSRISVNGESERLERWSMVRFVRYAKESLSPSLELERARYVAKRQKILSTKK